MVTTVFADCAAALARANDLGAAVRVLNLTGGTYHPKVYLTTAAETAHATVGSANLTSGLICNIETAVILEGLQHDPPLAAAWEIGERLWAHPSAVQWTPTVATPRAEPLGSPLFAALAAVLSAGQTVYTLGNPRPNTVHALAPEGVYLETMASKTKGLPPQLVPAWMIELAWDYLASHGSLTNAFLLADDGLNVKRSSAVCALLALLPDVTVARVRPIELVLNRA
jgi:hypothetical protein